MTIGIMSTYGERLQTFEGFWKEDQTTARQLAAIGHIADRPPLEAVEEGSRCIACGAFVRKDQSIRALGDAASYNEGFEDFNFHRPGCIRLQVRVPLEPQALLPGLYGHRFEQLRSKWERRTSMRTTAAPMEKVLQSSSLFSLPTELRLQIYAMVLPSLDSVTEIVTLNTDSARVITKQGYDKTGPRETTMPNILRTCRTVHEEAIDLIYSHTTFKFPSTKIMYLFLRNIGSAGRRLIKSIDIHCGGREDAIAFAMLASCESLRTITIRLQRIVILHPKPPPIWMFDGMSCLLALSGLEEVSFGDTGTRFSMGDDKADAEIIRGQLTRPKGTPGDDSIVKRYLEA